jgi:hypothetical protein
MHKTVSIKKAASPVGTDWWTLTAILFAFLGLAQFVQGISRAVEAYPAKYDWSGQFLSELGMTRTWSGESNMAGSLLFTRSMVGLGLLLIPFFSSLRRVESDSPYRDLASAWCGCVSACGLIGLGLTPLDKMMTLHNGFLAVWLFPLVVAMLVRLPQAWRSIPSLALSLLLTMTIAVFALSMGMRSAPLVQKAVIVLSALWLLDVVWQVVGAGTQYVREVLYADQRAVDKYVATLKRRGLFRGEVVHPNETVKRRPPRRA